MLKVICLQFDVLGSTVSTANLNLLIPRGKAIQFIIRHILGRLLLQQEFQIIADVQIISLRHFHHGVDCGAGGSTLGRIAEKPVAAPDAERANRILTQIIDMLKPPPMAGRTE